jgi:predicted ATPase/transcriptional regulator with XRE-family HTH domain
VSQLGERPLSFGTLLRDFRLAAGLSQETLAERAGMSAGGISFLERGVCRAPYRDTVALLAAGLDLSPENRRLLEAAAARAPQPRKRQGSPPSEPLDESAAHNLPIELTSFVGRTTDVAKLRALLTASRLVTVVGPGGVGKTRTALRVAEALIGSADAGVWFVDLAPVSDGSSLAATVANVIGAPTANRPALESLLAFAGRRDPIVVLDNCEHVLSDAARLCEALLRAGHQVRILATSREPLKAAGERVYRLPALTHDDAVALFSTRAEAADQRFDLSKHAPVVAEICRRLDGSPLAIELAAARSGTMPLVTLAENLDRRLSLLVGRGHVGVARHQTLRALIDWSYDLLAPSTQRVFERLSVFAGGATIATAARVCCDDATGEADMLENLTSLVDKSLVALDFEHEEPRYTLLESMRHYARDQLARRGEQTAMTHRHAVALVELAEGYECDWDTAPHPRWVDLMRDDMDNWRAVLDWALVSRGDVRLGQRLVAALHSAWVTFGLNDGHRWLRIALDLVDAQTPPHLVAALDYVHAKISVNSGEIDRALDLGRRAVDELDAVGDVRRRIGAQRVVADALLTLGHVAEAESLFTEILAQSRAGGYRWSVAFVLQFLGRISGLSGNIDEARAQFRASLAMLAELGDEYGVSAITLNLAEAEFEAGDAATALRLAEGCLASKLRRARALRSLMNIPAYLTALDRFDEAITHAREILRWYTDLTYHVRFLCALQHLVAAATLRLPRNADSAAYRDAARVLGFLDAELVALGSTREHTERQEYERLVQRLRATLGEKELADSMSAGMSVSSAAAISLAEGIARRAPAPA